MIGDIHHTIAAVWLYLLPSELLDVALFQCSKTGEQKGSLQGWSRAWCGCQAEKPRLLDLINAIDGSE